VREFNLIPTEGEFRGFVYKKNLTAVSQYDSHCYFPELVKNKDTIAKNFVEFHKSIKHLIEPESYIVDFAILKNGTIKIVELNPFGEYTGSALFSWKEDIDIIQGRKEFELRVRTSSDEKILDSVLGIWKPLILQAKTKSTTEEHNEEADAKKDNSTTKKPDKSCSIS